MPQLVHQTDRLFVRLGERRYRIERPWGRLPAGETLGQISHVGVDSRDNVYAVQRRDAVADPDPRDPITVFSPNGEYLRAFGQAWVADAHGIFITPDDVVLVADRDAHQVCAFDHQGALLFTLGKRHAPLEPFNHPSDIAVAPNGDIYVSDGYGNSRVHRFAADGRPLGAWGQPGRGPGEFALPHAVWVLDDERVLVADRENCRVQVFSPEGEFLQEWPDLYHPADIYADTSGEIYVTDETPRLTAFDNHGKMTGRCRPSLNTPHGIYGDSKGNLFIAEIQPSRIARLTRVDD